MSIKTCCETNGGAGNVISVFGRVGVVVPVADDYTWAEIDKTVSDLADLATANHSDLGLDDGSNPHGTTPVNVGLAGADTQVQYNNGGTTFGASANLVFSGTILTVGLNASGNLSGVVINGDYDDGNNADSLVMNSFVDGPTLKMNTDSANYSMRSEFTSGRNGNIVWQYGGAAGADEVSIGVDGVSYGTNLSDFNIAIGNGDVVMTVAGCGLVFGPNDADDSWQFVRSGNNLLLQRHESGSWATKDTWTP